jgi:DNA-binding FadR family transcriptional regulator
MPIQAIEPQRLYRQIAEQLRQLMAEGEFAVGTRLPAERELASQLGVSRPSVREALIALEVEGVIEVRTGSGIYVRQPSESQPPPNPSSNTPADWGPLEVMSARLVIEAEVAALAARHASRTDRKAIRGNSVLLDTVRRLWQARNGALFERLGDHFENPDSWQAAIEEHALVMQAIEAGDSPGARKAMQRHLRQAHKRYSASWRRAPAH